MNTGYIFICPKCNAVFERPDLTENSCTHCETKTVNSGYTVSQWYEMPQEARNKIIYPDDLSSLSKQNGKERRNLAESANPAPKQTDPGISSSFFYGSGFVSVLLGVIAIMVGIAMPMPGSLEEIFWLLGFLLVGAGVFIFSQTGKNEKIPVTRKRGMVIEVKSSYLVVLEFNDGSRNEYAYDGHKIFLYAGDFGDFEFKGSQIVGFIKLQTGGNTI